MKFVLDASVALRWFVDQPGSDAARELLRTFITDSDWFVAPDILRFEVMGGLARLQRARDGAWAERCLDRFFRLGIRTLPSDQPTMTRAIELARTLKIGGYDAVYLTVAEALGIPWVTADDKALRRLRRDPRVISLVRAVG